MNTKLHAVTDADDRPVRFFMTVGQARDYTGAAALLASLPAADWLLANRGYVAVWFREALKDKGRKPCMPGRKSRGKPIKHDKRRYKSRNRIEIMFRRLKDWRRVATHHSLRPLPEGLPPPLPSLRLLHSGYDARTGSDPNLVLARPQISWPQTRWH